jgi:hypothetical protein
MLYCITLKNSSLKKIKVKNIDIENIYKKCGYKSNCNFKKLYEWDCFSNIIELWSKEDSIVKTYNNHPLLVKYNIKVNHNNKCIFLLKSGTNYISLESELFSKFFNLPNAIENSINDISYVENLTNEQNTALNEIVNKDKLPNISDELIETSNASDTSDTHSELSYELYCYSDEDQTNKKN